MVRNVINYLIHCMEQYPGKMAFADEKRSITFRELYVEAKKVSCAIVNKCGNITNQPIMVYINRSVESVVAFMGILYSGNFYCPIDTMMPLERIEKIMSTLNATTLIYTDSIPDVKNVNRINLAETADISENEILKNEFGWQKILDVDPAYVLFTSGSTGQPKGVVINHAAIIDYVEWLHDKFGFSEKTVLGNQASFHFDFSVADIYTTLKNAATMYMIPKEKFAFPKELLTYVETKGINTVFWVPSVMISIANSGALNEVELTSLDKFLFCGEVMPNRQLNIWRRFYPKKLYVNMYGPTETTVASTYYIVDREFDDEEPLPIGKPCENSGILLLNQDNKLAETDEIGEICIKGVGISMGYYGDEEKTVENFVQNPLNNKYHEIIYRTGDLGKYNERQELIYVGRRDYQIKHQGYRIELGEIEAVADAVDGIDKTCALYDDRNKRIVLFCSITDKDITEKKIYMSLKNKLPRYMLPGLIYILEKLPLNVNGKIDRTELKRRLED